MCKINAASSLIGVVASVKTPFIVAAKVSLANLSPMLLATIKGVTPNSKSLVDLSGNVILT